MATEIRYAHGHRFVTDAATSDDRCLGCGWNGLGQITECRPGVPRCEECGLNPADVLDLIGDTLFVHCAPCRNKLRQDAGDEVDRGWEAYRDATDAQA